jgi:hypothetical protein
VGLWDLEKFTDRAKGFLQALANILFAIHAVLFVVISNPMVSDENYFPAFVKHFPIAFKSLLGEFADAANAARDADFTMPLARLEREI